VVNLLRVEKLKELMGHESVETTDEYTEPEWPSLVAAVNAMKFDGLE
jgi:site-specific recombinase XerD